MSTSSEQFRHQCEVRWVLTKGADWFLGYLRGVRRHRGRDAAKRLLTDVKAQHQRGNVGQAGDWRGGEA